MTILLVLGLILVAVAFGLAGMALRSDAATTGVGRSLAVLQAMTTAPKELRDDLEPSFSERVVEPLRLRALVVGRRLTGSDTAERLRRKLDLAGNPAGWSVDRIISMKVIAAAVGAVVALLVGLVLGPSFTVRLVLVAGGALLGFVAPSLWLYQRAHDRAERLQRDLPDAVDLLTISVESGLGFDAALMQVSRNTDGPLADELARVLREMQLGQGRGEALRGLAERTSVADVKTFVSAMVQADAFGIPVAQVLRVQSSEMRVKRRQRAETKAQQVPVKLTVPLIFFILPCLFVSIMGPAALTIMDNF